VDEGLDPDGEGSRADADSVRPSVIPRAIRDPTTLGAIACWSSPRSVSLADVGGQKPRRARAQTPPGFVASFVRSLGVGDVLHLIAQRVFAVEQAACHNQTRLPKAATEPPAMRAVTEALRRGSSHAVRSAARGTVRWPRPTAHRATPSHSAYSFRWLYPESLRGLRRAGKEAGDHHDRAATAISGFRPLASVVVLPLGTLIRVDTSDIYDWYPRSRIKQNHDRPAMKSGAQRVVVGGDDTIANPPGRKWCSDRSPHGA